MGVILLARYYRVYNLDQIENISLSDNEIEFHEKVTGLGCTKEGKLIGNDKVVKDSSKKFYNNCKEINWKGYSGKYKELLREYFLDTFYYVLYTEIEYPRIVL